MALPCQVEPVARVQTVAHGLHIDITPGPGNREHCAAIAIAYGLRLQFKEPLGARVITMQLIDPINQQLLDYSNSEQAPSG
jgi:hypothetical protein